MANPRIEELPDEPEATNDKKAQAEDASSSSGSEVEAGEGGDGMPKPQVKSSAQRKLPKLPTSA